jgi:6-phosphofructokinase 1
MSEVKRIAIITSGGDCQAMNATVRAVVLAARKYNIEVVGIMDGYYGMTHKRPGDYRVLRAEDVEDIISRGGTILNSARFDEFRQESVVRIAAKNMKDEGIGALVIAGGDGSFRGGLDLLKYSDIPCIGIPCTIDNDITSTEYTLGFDTALRNTIQMADALRDTCNSHKRCNVIEVMGRACGQIALLTAIAVGASAVAVPEAPDAFNVDKVIDKMIEARKRGKRSFLVVVAEGAVDTALTDEKKKSAVAAAVENYRAGKISESDLAMIADENYISSFGEQFRTILQRKSKEEFAKYYAETGDINFKGEYIETKFARFAHVARGGSPTVYDRLIASQMGELSVDLIASGTFNKCICVQDGVVTSMDMWDAINVDSLYRKYRKTGVEDAEAIAKLTPQQKKMYDFRFRSNERLLKTVAALSEI